jgi:hypothetical protein
VLVADQVRADRTDPRPVPDRGARPVRDRRHADHAAEATAVLQPMFGHPQPHRRQVEDLSRLHRGHRCPAQRRAAPTAGAGPMRAHLVRIRDLPQREPGLARLLARGPVRGLPPGARRRLDRPIPRRAASTTCASSCAATPPTPRPAASAPRSARRDPTVPHPTA